MRVFKKISTPFTKSNPDKAIIVVNMVDSQINTIRVFIDACNDCDIGLTVFCNKSDKVDNPREKAKKIKKDLGVKSLWWGSCETGKGTKNIKKYPDLWKGKRIIVLGVCNSGKTSLINELCGTKYKTGDIPGTTLEFTETKVDDEGTILIDSVGQLIDINKPMMVSIDFSDCSTIDEKIDRVFDEEILGIIKTKEIIKSPMIKAIKLLSDTIKNGNKIIVVGAGASSLVSKAIAGQGTECGFPIMVFTNDGAEIQPITFSKGLGENESAISCYILNAVNRNDCCIATSASGGTGFTYDLLEKARMKGAKTIAITENSDTPLGYNADIILKSEAKIEGPSSSKIMVSHLVIGHCLMLVLADELGVTADESIKHMLPSRLENKAMGIK